MTVARHQALKESPSQTAGPYVHIGCTPNAVGIEGVFPEDLGAGSPAGPEARGERITLTGCVWDGAGWALRDCMVETWQADASGRYPGQPGADPAVTGFARRAADPDTGEWRIDTVKPGPAPALGGLMAPHLTLWIVARGINLGLHTRCWFDDEDAANAACPVLSRIEQRNRVPTLIAKRTEAGAYRFDIRLQGDRETVFFDV